MERTRIGIDRALHTDWLDAAAGLAAQGVDVDVARQSLLRILSRELSSSGSRSAADKTASVLLRVWFKVDPEVRSLRDEAADRMPSLAHDERVAAHWALMLAAYPFFVDCATVAGRLLGLSDHFRRVEYARRVAELWGEQATANRASGRAIETMMALGVVTTNDAGVTATRKSTVGGSVTVLLLEGLMIGENATATPLQRIQGHPALFPFEIDSVAGAVAWTNRLAIERRGGDLDMLVRTR